MTFRFFRSPRGQHKRSSGTIPLPSAACSRAGLTLIEMLIVTAIIAILSIAMGIVVEKTLRGQAEINRRLEMQTAMMSAFAALARDTAGARTCRILEPSDTTSTATARQVLLLGLAGDESDSPPSASPLPTPTRWVAYQVRDGRLVRSVLSHDAGAVGQLDRADEKNRAEWARGGQTLADRVQSVEMKLSGPALSVDLMVGEYYYHRTMRSRGATTFLLPLQNPVPTGRGQGSGGE